MAPHSSALAWRIPGMGEPGGLPSMGLHSVGHDWSDLAAAAVCFLQLCFYFAHNICLHDFLGSTYEYHTVCFFSDILLSIIFSRSIHITTNGRGSFIFMFDNTWPASWETHMQVRKQQIELDMEQQTGSNLERSTSRLYIVTLLI